MPALSRNKKSPNATPVFVLDIFSTKADTASFYMERFRTHVKEHAFVNTPHKHDFYLILFFTNGTGKHIIDFQSYDVSPGTVFVMTPGQVHSWSLSTDADGFVIFCRPDFYQIQLNEAALVEFPFFHSLNATPFIRLRKDTMIDLVLAEMYSEFKKHDTPDLRLLRAYLDIVLLKLARNYQPDRKLNPSSTVYKIRKLEQLIEGHFAKLKHPSEYAELMNLTPSYLNTLCKENVGKTLSNLIQERIVLEARRLFAYTDLSVKEVGIRLGYTDSSYFTRFFRKNTELTPEEFKESINRPL